MTNADKLLEILKENFDLDFTSKEYLEADCDFIRCPDDVNDCLHCPFNGFWKKEYLGVDKE